MSRTCFVPFCIAVLCALFVSCDALNFAALGDEPEDGPASGTGQPPPTPPPAEEKNANVFVYPPSLFTSASVRYIDGTTSSGLKITATTKHGSFAIPETHRSKTMYSMTFSPGGPTVLMGRKAGDEKIKLEFDADTKKITFRTDDTGALPNPIGVGYYDELALVVKMLDKSTWEFDEETEELVPPPYLNAAFLQEADIDLFGDSVYKHYGSFKSWVPIGVVSDTTPQDTMPFRGVYDGGGKKLINLSIAAPQKYQGLFAKIASTGKVKNIFLRYSIIDAGDTSGHIAAINDGTIENCAVTDSKIQKALTVGSQLGGICGSNSTSGRIIACYYLGDIDGVDTVGGLAGVNNGQISASFHFGKATAAAGGTAHPIAGQAPGTFATCYWYNPSDATAADPQATKFAAASWPAFPATDTDPAAPWAAYIVRVPDTKESGRWLSIGTASDTPARTDLPRLWFHE